MRSFCLLCSLSIDFLFLLCFLAFWAGLFLFCSVPAKPKTTMEGEYLLRQKDSRRTARATTTTTTAKAKWVKRRHFHLVYFLFRD